MDMMCNVNLYRSHIPSNSRITNCRNLVIGILLSILIAACQAGVTVSPDQATIDAFNSFLAQLDQQPPKWQDVGQALIKQLQQSTTDTGKTLLAQVQSTYSDLLGQTEGATFCGFDFLGNRFSEQLHEIEHTVFPDKYPEVKVYPSVKTPKSRFYQWMVLLSDDR